MPDSRPVRASAGTDASLLDEFGFDAPGHPWMRRLRQAEAPLPGSIGPYELLEEVGRGGQGIVYRAVQPHSDVPIAVKRMLAGSLATAAMKRRFEREVQALTAVDHPNIVGIRAMEVVDGVPVLAMEWIEGEPINAWARNGRRRTQRAIVRMALKVCEAVQHAHQRGVIHRDLKPSNILIDGEDEPHVLDFGLAKSTDLDDSRGVSATLTDQFIGTLAYASPEQLRGKPDDIDVRSDVYSLGVVLYEMLTGKMPFKNGTSLAEITQAIEHGEPIHPSSIARRIDPELAAITLKALSKSRTARYQSADALATDLRAHLSGEPISVKPPGRAARLVAGLRRHRVAFGFAGTVFVLLSIAAVVTGALALRLAAQRDVAISAGHSESEARARAEREAARARSISEFLQHVLASADPTVTADRNLTVRAVLDRAAREIEQGMEQAPEVEASLRTTMGLAYRALGLVDAAEHHLSVALELRKQAYGKEHVDYARSLDALGNLLINKGDYVRAESLLREALAVRRKLLGDEHIDVAETIANLGSAVFRRGDAAAAAELFRESLAMSRKLRGDESPEVALTLANLGSALKALGDLPGAERDFREALALLRMIYGDTRPGIPIMLNNLGDALLRLGDDEAAEQALLEALALDRKLLGEEHPDMAFALANLGALYAQRGNYEQAERYSREALAMRRKLLGPAHPDTLVSLNNLAHVCQDQGKLVDAAKLYEKVLDTAPRALPPDHWFPALCRSNYGKCLTALGRYEEAEAQLRQSVGQLEKLLGAEDDRTKAAGSNLRALYKAWGKPERAFGP